MIRQSATGIGFLIAANYQYWQLGFEMSERLPNGQNFAPESASVTLLA